MYGNGAMTGTMPGTMTVMKPTLAVLRLATAASIVAVLGTIMMVAVPFSAGTAIIPISVTNPLVFGLYAQNKVCISINYGKRNF